MVYAIGCNIVIENLQTRRQEFLVGHNNNVSCIAISKSGRFIATGQVTYMGFKVKKLLYFMMNDSLIFNLSLIKKG